MRIAFHFNPDKAVQAIGYILSALGGTMEKVKLTKLLYLADRQFFIERGVSITGDRLVAMPYGPVPSGCLDLLSGVALIGRRHAMPFQPRRGCNALRSTTPPSSGTDAQTCGRG